MKQLKEWSRSLAVGKKIVMGMSTLIAVVLVVCSAACSNGKEVQKEAVSAKEKTKEDIKKEEPGNSLKDFIDIEDIYVRINSKNVDLAKAVEVKKGKTDIVDKIEVDTSKVDYTKTGTYDVVYTVTLKPDVVEAGAEKEKAENGTADTTAGNKNSTDSKDTAEKADTKSTVKQTDTANGDTKDKDSTEDKDSLVKTEQEVITGNGKIEVVTEEKAKELAQAGKDVLISDNQMMAKEDKKKEEVKEEQKEETANTGNGGQATGNSNSGNQTASKPAGHTHNWVAQYQTVTDYQNQPVYENQPIYETRPVYGTEYHYICNCGTDCGRDMSAHLASGCFQSYSVKAVSVQTGTETVQVGSQQVQVGTQQVAVGSHQECVGYACSCGATK